MLSNVMASVPAAWVDRVLYCSDTWKHCVAQGHRIENRPVQPETWDAIGGMVRDLLDPMEAHFGAVELTYGFCGRELEKAIRTRAAEMDRLPNINPRSDQHAGHELNSRGTRICKRDGFAVDLRVPGHSSEDVVRWLLEGPLPFDWIYVYSSDRPFHLSWAPPAVAQRGVLRMVPWKGGGGRLVPRWISKGGRV